MKVYLIEQHNIDTPEDEKKRHKDVLEQHINQLRLIPKLEEWLPPKRADPFFDLKAKDLAKTANIIETALALEIWPKAVVNNFSLNLNDNLNGWIWNYDLLWHTWQWACHVEEGRGRRDAARSRGA